MEWIWERLALCSGFREHREIEQGLGAHWGDWWEYCPQHASKMITAAALELAENVTKLVL